MEIKETVEGMMTFEPWEEETNRVIAAQLVENIEKLLKGKATRSTVVNSRGEVEHRIIISWTASMTDEDKY